MACMRTVWPVSSRARFKSQPPAPIKRRATSKCPPSIARKIGVEPSTAARLQLSMARASAVAIATVSLRSASSACCCCAERRRASTLAMSPLLHAQWIADMPPDLRELVAVRSATRTALPLPPARRAAKAEELASFALRMRAVLSPGPSRSELGSELSVLSKNHALGSAPWSRRTFTHRPSPDCTAPCRAVLFPSDGTTELGSAPAARRSSSTSACPL
mmetsp:Transcript_22058/g.45324  ORF Transcript_22058/g.45324 Transcript_22058/m.45324 type:complete len:218 (+) Transcript_22058:548-1201(+)